MESHSDDSSPYSREIECETVSHHHPPPPASARVKLMCSYGGRILLRPHDNQIAYVGGETKILAVDRSIRFPAFLARVAALLPAPTDGDVLCFKYQLPGEDLDALISVTDDEDLDHMMIEYDRLVRLTARTSPRLRLFIFISSSATSPTAAAAAPPEEKKVVSSPTATAPPEEKKVVSSAATSPTAAVPPEEEKVEQRQWFEDALSSRPAPKQPPIHTVSTTPSPDFLSGPDKSSVPAPEPAVAAEDLEAEIVSPPAVVSPSSSEIQRQIEELQRLQIAAEHHQEMQRLQIAAENHQEMQRQQNAAAESHRELQRLQIAAAENHQHQQQVAIQQNGRSYDVLATTGIPARNYYMKAGPPPAAQIPAGYWAEQKPSSGGEEQQAVFLIPAAPGMFPGHPGAYYAAVTRMVPAAGGETTGYQVAYDSAGRAVYYRGVIVPTYQIAGPMSAGVVEDSKPAQVS